MKSTTPGKGLASVAGPLSRRQFLGGATLASAAFMIVPSHVLGQGGKKPPSEKLKIAGLGVGGQGGGTSTWMRIRPRA